MKEQNNHEEKKKPVEIIVNGRLVETNEKKLDFVEVITIAYGNFEEGETTEYSVTYSKGHGNSKGTLLPGEEVSIKKGMVFNVFKTTRS